MSDPRVYFAAERTLLAWIRTGLTVMGFGFVVARFGLFLRLLDSQQGHTRATATLHTPMSSFVGIALVVIGAVAMFVAARQYRRFTALLPSGDVPPSHAPMIPVALAAALGCLGILLAIYLAV